MKPKINGIIVVEGTNDASLISSLIDCEVVTLNGCELQNIKYLKKTSKITKLYLLTDPDEEGLKIRGRFKKEIPDVVDIEINIQKCSKGIKNGVAECENSEVLRVFSQYFETESTSDVAEVNTIFTKDERKIICSKLGIEEVNNKQLNRRLNALKITRNEINKMLEE